MKKQLATLVAILMPISAFAAEWQTDYGKALKLGKDRDVPVFVYFGEEVPADVAKNLEAWAKDFILVKAVKNTPAGDKLFRLFEMSNAGCAVVERTQKWQFARYERQLSAEELETVFRATKGASGEPTVDVLQTVNYEENVDLPQVTRPIYSTWPTSTYCPSCRR